MKFIFFFFNLIFCAYGVLFRSHEQMSVDMVDYIVDEHAIDIDSDTVKKVKVS